jgi:hypothetical protein
MFKSFIKKIAFSSAVILNYNCSSSKPFPSEIISWLNAGIAASAFSLSMPNFKGVQQKYSTGIHDLDASLQKISLDYMLVPTLNSFYEDFLKYFGSEEFISSSCFKIAVKSFENKAKFFGKSWKGIPGVYNFIKNKYKETNKSILFCSALTGVVFSMLKNFIDNKISEKAANKKNETSIKFAARSAMVLFDKFVISHLIEQMCLFIAIYFSKDDAKEKEIENQFENSKDSNRCAEDLTEIILALKNAI